MSAWTAQDISNLSFANVRPDEADVIRELLAVWQDRLDRNMRRTLYYDGEQAFKDLGLMLPPQLRNARFYLGWATMAVREAAIRSQFDGLRLPGSDDPFELGQTLDENDFGLEFSQSVISAYQHGVSFVTVARGDVGESAVQIQGHSADTSAALWDRRVRRVKAALTISEFEDERPSRVIVYLPHVVLICDRAGRDWSVQRIANRVGRPLVVPVTYDPQNRKPFGRSRITNPVMSLTDMAVRAYVRMEGNAEFYSSPQLAIEGIDPEAFEDGSSQQKRFNMAMDRLVAVSRDENNTAPTIKQMQQATMAPHSDMLRTVTMAFAGETGIPPASLGLVQDNPSSAEAIRAAEHKLLIEVNYQNKFVLSSAVRNIGKLAVMVRDGLSEPPAEAHRLSASFIDPEFRSTSAKADAAIKLTQIPDVAESSVLLEEVFDQDKVDRIVDERRRRQAGVNLQNLLDNGGSGATKRDRDEAETLRLRAQALSELRSAGVSAEAAAQLVGLSGVEFDEPEPMPPALAQAQDETPEDLTSEDDPDAVEE